MKAVRTYATRSCWVWCVVDFVTDDKDWDEDPEQAAAYDRYSIHMRAQVYYRRPKSAKDCFNQFSVRAHPNIPRKVIFEEAERFIETIKTMYEL